ncbi:MAG TPA: response regulator [Actinomycetota bacterium]|nr:response regulator [Actinomycetota bacterium]
MIPSYRPINILLVEDNPGDVELTEDALRRSKVATKVSVVTDGEDAMNYLRQQCAYEEETMPDLVLLDLNLPRKDGMEVLKEMKDDPNLRHIPVVVLTTSEAERDILASYELGANCFISKPVDLTEFRKVVESIDDFWFTIVKLPSPSRVQ